MGADRPAAETASVAAVLGTDDLLREILLRVDFPNYLVRSALVSKQWLLLLSDPAFLSCFHGRHPPSLLGFCVGYPVGTYEFVPLPQPPELAALSRRAASSYNHVFAEGRGDQRIKHQRNGRIVMCHGSFKSTILMPLLAEEPKLVLPSNLPFGSVFLTDHGGRDGITLVRFSFGQQVRAKVHMLRSGGWGAPATAVIEIEPPYHVSCFLRVLPPVHGMIFVVTNCQYTLGLDLSTPRFFIIELPDGVESNFMLSCAPNLGLYLINAVGFQICVWLHQMKGDNYAASGWLRVDTFSVHEVCAPIVGEFWSHNVQVVAVGDNAEFVFLDHPASGVVFYLHMKSKVVDKVYQTEPRVTPPRLDISPLMIWPPIFPARNIVHGQEE